MAESDKKGTDDEVPTDARPDDQAAARDHQGAWRDDESARTLELRDHPASDDRLALDDDAASLPWLQSDDDIDDDAGGASAGRVAGLVLIGLALLAAIVGGIYWATQRDRGDALVAQGGVIEAPAQPYKEAPEDPGGKTFAGTGDSSFVVSEGQSRPARMGDAPAPPAASATPAPEPAASESDTAATGGVGVQVGAYSSRASAEAGWSTLVQQYEALSTVKHRIVEGHADIGVVYRLQAVAADVAGANALCGQLKAAGAACQVKR